MTEGTGKTPQNDRGERGKLLRMTEGTGKSPQNDRGDGENSSESWGVECSEGGADRVWTARPEKIKDLLDGREKLVRRSGRMRGKSDWE